jgi:hypothetical protein
LYKTVKANEKVLDKIAKESSKTRKHIQDLLPEVVELLDGMSSPVTPGLGEGSSYSLDQKKRASKIVCESEIKASIYNCIVRD